MASDLYRVIRTDGVRSKPTTAQKIIEMFRSGHLDSESVVREEGGKLDMPIGVFADLQSIGSKPARKPETFRASPEPHSFPAEMRSANASSQAAVIGGSSLPTAPPSTSEWKPPVVSSTADSIVHDRDPSDLFGGWFSLLTFGGLSIPRDGRKGTRRYLRYQLMWLERWLKIGHFLSVLLFWMYIAGTAGLIYERLSDVIDVWKAQGRNAGLRELADVDRLWFYVWLFTTLTLILWRVLEAVLRLIPAALRYWMAVTEEGTTERRGA